MAESITYDELLAELRRFNDLPENAEGGLTTIEWADHWGVSQDRALSMIGRAVRVGVMTCVGRHHRHAIDGTLRRSPVYAIVKRTQVAAKRPKKK